MLSRFFSGLVKLATRKTSSQRQIGRIEKGLTKVNELNPNLLRSIFENAREEILGGENPQDYFEVTYLYNIKCGEKVHSPYVEIDPKDLNYILENPGICFIPAKVIPSRIEKTGASKSLYIKKLDLAESLESEESKFSLEEKYTKAMKILRTYIPKTEVYLDIPVAETGLDKFRLETLKKGKCHRQANVLMYITINETTPTIIKLLKYPDLLNK